MTGRFSLGEGQLLQYFKTVCPFSLETRIDEFSFEEFNVKKHLFKKTNDQLHFLEAGTDNQLPFKRTQLSSFLIYLFIALKIVGFDQNENSSIL